MEETQQESIAQSKESTESIQSVETAESNGSSKTAKTTTMVSAETKTPVHASSDPKAKKITQIKKRDGKLVEFNPEKIKTAIKKAFIVQNIFNEPTFESLANQVVHILETRFSEEQVPSVEDAQDIVEVVLQKNGYAGIAQAYIEYREKHKALRQEKVLDEIKSQKLLIKKNDGRLVAFNPSSIRAKIENAAIGLDKISIDSIVDDVCKLVHNEITSIEISALILNSTKARIEEHYNYSLLASRLLFNNIYQKILAVPIQSDKLNDVYQYKFIDYVGKGIDSGLLTPKLKEFDLLKLSNAIVSSRDTLFHYLGAQTIYDRYLLRDRTLGRKIFELPQWMWMRVSMGLALTEKNKTEKAIEFYNALSNMYVVSSTPTLFNSGTMHSQMSSCYLNTVEDSLSGIFKNYSDNAQLSKWAGGIGTDWTPVRSSGSDIKGTNGISQGIIPFVKIFNDVALAVNQGGKRKGAMAAYLEIWHRDIIEFAELKKNSGDERRRAHDIHPAAFIPDLFMQRVKEDGNWTLFSPTEVPELHDSYGKEFKEKYEFYEKQDLPTKKTMKARDLWKKLLTMLYETGHPWITFKDTMNVRNPQSHVGVIHSSNLCTEITLNTSKDETAVCNLASLNLAKMVKGNDLDEELLKNTVFTAMRMLDNVVDNNYYPVIEAENSNLRHRPVGLGIMGYQDVLYQLGIAFDSEEQLEFADKSMEMISYYSILGSSKLAKEKGTYSTYKGSKWDQGIFPLDTVDILEKERGETVKVNRKSRMGWSIVKEHVKQHGMRNSNCMAIAPTATISNISGTTPCVEPTFKNIYMKENLSGNFVIVNRYLMDSLEEKKLLNRQIITQIKLNDGSVQNIPELPADLKGLFKETFEIDPKWTIDTAALRSKWIDQSASTNVFISTTSGKVLSDIYMRAWEYGLKTTYYLRTLAASQVTKTITTAESADSVTVEEEKTITEKPELKVCGIDKEDCEACQ